MGPRGGEYPRQVVIVSIGDLVLDVRIVPEGPLEPDDDSPASIAIGGGGQAANFCAWTAASGEPVRLVTRIGEDDTGRRLVSDLEARGVEVRAVWAAEPTGIVAVVVGPDGRRSRFHGLWAQARGARGENGRPHRRGRCFRRHLLHRLAARGDARRGGRAGGPGSLAVGDAGRGAADLSDLLELAPEVAAALERGRPVVALETSIVGQGLPSPHNLRAARGCESAIRDEGATPATVAVLDGRLRVGLSDADLERIASGSVKVSSRDLGPSVVRRAAGATTVAATMRVAAMAGVRFLATGGIGGVHRGHPEDQSADLEELARSPLAVFCAGAKIILDLRLTLERLESLSVPVLGYGIDEFPAFYSRRSGCRVGARVDGVDDCARALQAAWDTGTRGIVVAIPPPAELHGAEEVTRRAVDETHDVSGSDLTPRLLARVAELSGGRSLDLNVDVVVNNARVAAQVAQAYFGFDLT